MLDDALLAQFDYSAFVPDEPFPVSCFVYACELCDRPYKIDGKHTWNKYCSDECRQEMNRAAKTKFRRNKLGQKPICHFRICVTCGNAFRGTSTHQKACSPMCAKARKQYRDRVWVRKKHGSKSLADVRCNECNEMFHQVRINQKCCSIRCKNRHYHRLHGRSRKG